VEAIGQASALDVVLAVGLPLLAWRVITRDDLRKSVVLFIAFGLLSALAWARLRAPDIALVEAAVGTGLTGTLLMSAVRAPEAAGRARTVRVSLRAALPLGLLGVTALVLGKVVRALASPHAGLSEQVSSALGRSGVSHPVTAVLLNFRSYDTFLEVLVLVVAAVGVQYVMGPDPVAAGPAGSAPQAVSAPAPAGPPLDGLLHLLTPGFVLVAGYLVWTGAHAPGGAFQAAAVLAGGGVLLLLAGRLSPPRLASLGTRAVMFSGPAVYLLLASVPVLGGEPLLRYPESWAGALILLLESLLTGSMALILVMFLPLDPAAGARSAQSGGER
jgi:multisubunit Na+/H+ antiporter MnhB subunit